MALRYFRCVLLLFILCSGLGWSVAAGAGERVALQGLKSEPVYPGDLFELTLQLRSESFSRWELDAPRHPQLRLLTTQAFPLRPLPEGGYLTEWILAYQAVEPGKGLLSGGVLRRVGGAGQDAIALEELPVSVEGFAGLDEEEGVEALPLPAAAPEPGRLTALGLAAGCAALALLFFAWWRLSRRRLLRVEVPAAAESGLASVLAEAASSGPLTERQAARLLNEYGEELSASCRQVLERFAYSKSGDSRAAREALRKEVAR